jgi:hypothetical protein
VGVAAEAPSSCGKGNCNMDQCTVPPVNRHHCSSHRLRPCYCGSLPFLDRRYNSAGTRCSLDADE